MFKKGLAVAVILLFIGVAFTSSINANVSKSSVEPIADVDVIEENATPIVLVLQLISKLRNHKDIQNVESEEDVFQIIESDDELNSIVEQLSVEDCGCEEDNSELNGKDYPIICALLQIPLFFSVILLFTIGRCALIIGFVFRIGKAFNCSWA